MFCKGCYRPAIILEFIRVYSLIQGCWKLWAVPGPKKCQSFLGPEVTIKDHSCG